jgi:hypothetical protein
MKISPNASPLTPNEEQPYPQCVDGQLDQKQ